MGNGLTKYYRPGKHGKDYPELAQQAMTRALNDANIQFGEVQEAYVGYASGPPSCG